jgi:hypothetical protein
VTQKSILILVLSIALIGISFFEPVFTDTPVKNELSQKNFSNGTFQSISNTATTTESVMKPAQATSTKKIIGKTVQVSTPIVQSPAPITTSPVENKPAANFEQINETARKSVVNILCQTKSGGTINPITGTGVVIDSRGIILTNAHIAQYFLIKDLYVEDFVQCTIRTGSPAYPRYNAELVYISPTWVENNKAILRSTNPKGTGENDYAFLRITSSIDGSLLPNFPHLTIKVSEGFEIGEVVNLVAYPAGFLGGQSVQQDLSLTSALTTIQEVFTFKDTTTDLISIPGTILSQKGASGGAVVNKDTSLVGIITTSSDAPTTDKRDLRAIALPYINRAIEAETGMNLPSFLSQNLAVYAKNFQLNTAPSLSKLIQDELLK